LVAPSDPEGKKKATLVKVPPISTAMIFLLGKRVGSFYISIKL
jgi:hypothetical protein